jgi:CopA family copper-resistance protein
VGLLCASGTRWARAGGEVPGNILPSAPAELSGTDFALTIGALPVNFTGRARQATVVNGQLPAPVLRWREGDLVTLRVTNHLPEPTSIHWHGVIVPADMDGVPGISFHGIAPGDTYVYRFRVNQSGTYWYHSHSRYQEHTGLYGPIVIEPRRGERHQAGRDYTVLLSDWSDMDPEAIYRRLKVQSDYFNYRRRTFADFVRDARTAGLSQAIDDHSQWALMRMDPTDLADVSGAAYTYLLNGTPPAGNWTGLFTPGEKVRLRIINGAAMSYFDLRIPGLKLTVIAADGQDVEPVTVDEVRIGTAEVLDVLIQPEDRAYTLFAQSLDRTGYARGTLAPRPGMQADVPALDPPALLTMADMGMAHHMAGMEGMSHDMAGMSHDMSMQGMHHDMAGMQGMEGMDMTPPVHHAPAEHGPGVDMLATKPQSRLDDPGVGLRGNGRRVLTYADLHTIGGPIDPREPGREIELHLTGHMQRYMWSFNGEKFSQAPPLRFQHGERLRLVLVNDTMMNHPLHLHGMWSEIENEDGEFLVRKHTLTVQPGQRLTHAITADALGAWAYHCHLAFHMQAGMFREVLVESAGASRS